MALDSAAPPRALIFDCDGTLADTMPPHYEAWAATLKAVDLSLSEDRFYALGGWPTLRIAELLVSEAKRSLDPVQLAHEKEANFELLLAHVRPIAPVLALAEANRGRLPMAVATGGTRRICETILRHIGCFEWFDTIVCCEDVRRHKPEPDIFLEAARRLNTPPPQCLVYEDTNPGVEAARRAEMQCVDVRTLFTPRRVTPA